MARFSVSRFYGIAPNITPRQLADGMAQVAVNCELGHGRLEPLYQDRIDGELPTSPDGRPVQSLYKFGGSHWFTFFEDVDVVRGPLAEDTTERTYFTDSQYPKVTRNDVALGADILPAASYKLGVPAPEHAPTVTVTGSGDEDNEYATAYVYTWVTAWGEEGPPSPPSLMQRIDPGQTVTVSADNPPSGHYNWEAIRFYRLNSGSSGADYQFVAELPLPMSEDFVDTVANDELGELLPSLTWYPPPDESHPTGPLRGLIGLPNGSLAGFTGQTLCISEPNLPHAWPYENRYTIIHNIVGLAVSSAGVVVLTDAYPYIAAGTDPSSAPPQRLPEAQACVSKRSIVDMGGYVIYASPDGLVGIEGATARVLTEGLIAPDQWRARYRPETLHAYFWEGRYVGFYIDAEGVGRGFIFNPRGAQQAFVELTLYADAGFTDFETDTLVLAVNNQRVAFNQPSEPARVLRWRSAEFVAPIPSSMAAVRVVAEAPVQVRVQADGILVLDREVDGQSPARLPSGFRAKVWEVEVEGTTAIDQIDLVSSVQELQP